MVIAMTVCVPCTTTTPIIKIIWKNNHAKRSKGPDNVILSSVPKWSQRWYLERERGVGGDLIYNNSLTNPQGNCRDRKEQFVSEFNYLTLISQARLPSIRSRVFSAGMLFWL